MKLYYFKKKEGNFGDDLNGWLWQELVPNAFDEDERSVFFGIGTIINDRIYERAPKADKIVVFGSGVGYGRTPLRNLPDIGDKWKVYCVRGPLSARALGLKDDMVVSDAAVLIRRLFKCTEEKKYSFSYIPHVNQAIKHGGLWKRVCDQLGYGYIDPRWSRDEVLRSLCQAEVIIAEAMHGAIVADALRIPWIAARTTDTIFEFKWQDWCRSVDLNYQPQTITGLPKRRGIEYSAIEWLSAKKIARQMEDIAKLSPPLLSKDSKIEQVTVRLEEKLQDFKKDLLSGIF